jgi:uncharacterized membrane protein (DUF485 family)
VCGLLAALWFVVPPLRTERGGRVCQRCDRRSRFLASLFATALFSLYLLFVTLRAYRDISTTSILAGIILSIVVVAALALLFGYLRY